MRKRQPTIALTLLALTACFTPPSEDAVSDEVGHADAALSVGESASLWTGNLYRVPICWQIVAEPYPGEIAMMQAAIEDTWERETGLDFTFQTGCPSTGAERFLKVAIQPLSGPATPQNGGVTANSQIGMNKTLRYSWQGPTVEVQIAVGQSPDPGRLEHVIVHAIGHALGFRHEQDRPENDGAGSSGEFCDLSVQTGSATWWLGPYDQESIMSFCAASNGTSGDLSALDVEGARAAYGWPGFAIDIAVGTDQNHPWVVGISGRVFRWQGSGGQWQVERDGDHIAIDVGDGDDVWVVAADNRIYRRNVNTWELMPGRALDVGVAPDGAVYVVGTSQRLFQWDDANHEWDLVNAGPFRRVDAGPNGDLALVTTGNNMSRRHDGGWQHIGLLGSTEDVAISSSGEFFRVSTTGHVERWDEATSSLQTLSWSAPRFSRISAGPNGQVGAIDDQERIFIRKDFRFEGQAVDIGVGDDEGKPWVIGSSARVFRRKDGEWDMIRDGSHVAVDAGGGDTAYAVESGGMVYRFDGGGWSPMFGALATDVGANTTGDVCIVDVDGDLQCRFGFFWQSVRTFGSHVAVDVGWDGRVWAVTAGGALIVSDGPLGSGNWSTVALGVTDVGCSVQGWTYTVDDDGEVSRRTPDVPSSVVQTTPGSRPSFTRVSGGPHGRVGVVEDDQAIWLFAD